MTGPSKTLYNVELTIFDIKGPLTTRTGGTFFVIKTVNNKDVVYWHKECKYKKGDVVVFTDLDVQKRGNYDPQFHTTDSSTDQLSQFQADPRLNYGETQIMEASVSDQGSKDDGIDHFKCPHCKKTIIVSKKKKKRKQ